MHIEHDSVAQVKRKLKKIFSKMRFFRISQSSKYHQGQIMDHSRFDWVPDFVRDIADDVLRDWGGDVPRKVVQAAPGWTTMPWVRCLRNECAA